MMTHDERESAKTSAYWCYFLAVLIMLVTAFFIFQGVQTTEPASPARTAKIAAGCLLLVLEGFAFSTAGRWREFSRPLWIVGGSIFILQIAVMTLAQYSIGSTAGKAAALATATVDEIRAQADAERKAAQALQQSSDKLSKSRHSWINAQGGQVATAAAERTAAAGSAVEKLEKLKTENVSTPLVEIVGETGLLVLSLVFSVIFEGTGLVLMYIAGSLRGRASRDAESVRPIQVAPVAIAAPAALVKRSAPHTLAEPRAHTLRAASQAGRAAVAPAAPAPAQVQDSLDDAPAAPVADALAPVDAPAQVQSAKSAAKPVPDGVREAIRSGAIRPSQGGIKSMGHGQDFAAAWLEQLGAEGVLEPAGRGRWRLAKAKD